jgi:hypothetical protein
MIKTDCNKYRGISRVLTSYKIVWYILLPKLNTYTAEIVGDNQCGFRRNRSVTDCRLSASVRNWRKKWEYNETVQQLFIDFKKAHKLVRKEELYNILIEFGVSMKLFSLIKVCLNKTYSKIRIGKYLLNIFLFKMI